MRVNEREVVVVSDVESLFCQLREMSGCDYELWMGLEFGTWKRKARGNVGFDFAMVHFSW